MAVVLSGLVLLTLMSSCGGENSPTGSGKALIKFISNATTTVHITIQGTPHDFFMEPGEKATKEVAGENGSTGNFMVDVTIEAGQTYTESVLVSVGQTVTITFNWEVLMVDVE